MFIALETTVLVYYIKYLCFLVILGFPLLLLYMWLTNCSNTRRWHRVFPAMGRTLIPSTRHCWEQTILSTLLRTNNINFACWSSQKGSVGLISPRVEHWTLVCLPATSPMPQILKKSRNGWSPSHPRGHGVGQESVVSGNSGHEHLSTDEAALLGWSFVSVADQSPAPKPAQSTSPIMEMGGDR